MSSLCEGVLSSCGPEPGCRDKRLVFLEGNIGIGKSSVLAGLASAGCAVAPEDVDDPAFRGALLRFQEHPTTSFHLQVAANVDLLRRVVRALRAPESMVVLERGPVGSEVFSSVGRDRETLDNLELRICGAMLQSARDLLRSVPVTTLMLTLEPAAALQRVRERSRPGEDKMGLSYMTDVDRSYRCALAKVPGVVYVDASRSSAAVTKEVLALITEKK